MDGPRLYHLVTLGNGVVAHLFGEHHNELSTCARCAAGCMTLTAYVAALVDRARDGGGRLDVFLEEDWPDARGVEPLEPYGWEMVEDEEEVRHASALERLRATLGRTGAFRGLPAAPGPVRVHQMDIRGSSTQHPLTRYAHKKWVGTDGVYWKALPVDVLRRVFVISLDSDRYVADLANAGISRAKRPGYATRHPRNATSYRGSGDISRVRKQLLKLPAPLRARLRAEAGRIAATFRGGRKPEALHLLTLLMDVHLVARMLYYAGYGVDRPQGGTAGTVVAHGGAAHTDNWLLLLRAVGVVRSVSTQTGCVSAPAPA